MRKRKNSGLSNVVTNPVSLKVLDCGWIGRRLYRYFPVADFNARRLGRVAVARMFQKTGWSERGSSRIVHAVRTHGRIAMSGSDRQSKMERTIEDCRGCGKMDCGRAGWTADLHFSTLASQRKKTWRIRGCLDGNPRVLEWEAQTTCDLGWRLQCEPVWYDRLSPCGRVDPETENVDRHKRFIACESATHDGDRTGSDGDKHVDECRHRTRAFHAIQLVKQRGFADTNGFHHDFEEIGNETCAGSGLRLVQDRSQSGVCSSFGETENEVHDEEWCKLAWLSARRILARCGCSNIDRLEELEQGGTFACGNRDGSQKGGISKGMTVTEMELKTLLLRKKKTFRYFERSELNWLCGEIWRKRRALKREKHLDKIKESAEMGRAPKKTQSKHFNWKSIAEDENPKSVLTKYFRDLYSISEEQEELTQSERRQWVELWKT